jgi:CrcB protein
LATHGAIGAGGLLGANARYFMGVWAAERWGTAFPWGTFLINVVGSFLLGFYLTLVTERFTGRAVTRLFVATGFLGAFTTFSTFGYETAMLLRDGSPAQALAYVAASLVVGVSGVIAGILAAHSL